MSDFDDALVNRAISDRARAIADRDKARDRIAAIRAAADELLDHLDEVHPECAEADAFRAVLMEPDR